MSSTFYTKLDELTLGWGDAENFALIRSVISTARKQGRNIWQVLTDVLKDEVIVFS